MPQQTVIVAAAQMNFAWAATPQEYFDRMHAPIARAARRGAQLVVLPQFTGDMLVGVLVPTDPAAGLAELAVQAGFASWYECVRATAQTTAELYVHTFESLAQRYQLYLVPGTLSLPGEVDGAAGIAAPIFHAAFLFGPDGAVLGEQRQLFANGAEEPATRYGTGTAPLDTEIGRIALVVGDDPLHSDLAANIVTLGCAVVANPMARRNEADREVATARWRSLAEAGIYVVEAAVVGGPYVGRSAIHGPLFGDGAPAGLLAQASADDRLDQVIDATVTLR